MSRIDLSELTNLENESSAVGAINVNSELLESIMDKTLFRTGEGPNHMEAQLDMNSNKIINLPAAVASSTDPVRAIDLPSLVPDIAVGQLAIDEAIAAKQDAQNAAAQAIAAAGSIVVGTLGTQNRDAVNITGGTIANTTITGVPSPHVASDIANKQYADLQNPENARVLVRAATTGTLSGSPTYTAATSTTPATLEATVNGALTVDGVIVNDGDRVLVKDQSTADQNSVYVKSTVGSHYKLTEAADIDNNLKGEAFYVSEGTVNADKSFARVGNTPNYYTDTVIIGTNSDFATSGRVDVVERNTSKNTADIDTINTAIEAGVSTLTSLNNSITSLNNSINTVASNATNASNLTSGTLSDARLPTLLSAGTVGDATHSAILSYDNKGRLTSVGSAVITGTTDASQLTTGTLPDARLSNTISPNTVGDSSHIPVITYDAHGRLTSVTSQAVSSSSFSVGIVSPGINSIVGNDTTDKTTIAAVISAAGMIHFYPGTYLIDDNTTWSANKIYVIHPGAYIKVSSTKTLTINGVVEAGRYKIFGTSAAGWDLQGTVTAIAKVKPDWWGVVRNDKTGAVPANNYTATQASINCMLASSSSDGDAKELSFGFGNYYFNQSLIVNVADQGRVRVCGSSSSDGGTRLIAVSSFTGSKLLQVGISSNAEKRVDIIVEDLCISNDNASGGPASGLVIGGDAGLMHAMTRHKVRSIHINGFARQLQVQNCREAKFEAIYTWPGAITGTKTDEVGVLITGFGGCPSLGPAYDNFCGDHEFISCTFVASSPSDGSSTSRCVSINDLGTSKIHLSAVRFIACIFYNGASSGLEHIVTASGSTVDDIWVTSGSQFENGYASVGSLRSISMFTDNGAIVRDIHIDHVYMIGYGFYKNIEALIGIGGGTLQNFFISNNIMNNTLHELIDIRGTNGTALNFSISGNIFNSPNGTGASNDAVYLESANYCTVIGNTISSTPGNTRSHLAFANAGGSWFVASGNNSGGWATTTPVGHSGTVNTLYLGLNI